MFNYEFEDLDLNWNKKEERLDIFIGYFSTMYPNIKGQDILDLIRIANFVLKPDNGVSWEKIDSIIFKHVGN